MTATAKIVATKDQSTTAVFSIAAGSVGNFIAIGLVKDDEPVVFEGSDAAGTGFEPLSYIDQGGDHRTAQLTYQHRTIQIAGPADIRINKPATQNAAEITQYT